jgi:hypothetical protein
LIVKAPLTRSKSLAARKMIPIASPQVDRGTALKQAKILLLKFTRVEIQARAHTQVVKISRTMTTSHRAHKTRSKWRKEMLRMILNQISSLTTTLSCSRT